MNKMQKTRLTSAGELNDYMHVTTVPVWVVIAAIGAFLAGLVIWSIGGRLTSKIAAAATVKDGVVSLYIREPDASSVTPGITAVVGGSEITIQSISSKSVPASSVMNTYTRLLIGVREDEPVCVSENITDLPNGNYNASVIIERIRPISFLFGGMG